MYQRKYFKTMKQAERYRNKLYSAFNHVQLIEFPIFSEEGWYVFEIGN